MRGRGRGRRKRKVKKGPFIEPQTFPRAFRLKTVEDLKERKKKKPTRFERNAVAFLTKLPEIIANNGYLTHKNSNGWRTRGSKTLIKFTRFPKELKYRKNLNKTSQLSGGDGFVDEIELEPDSDELQPIESEEEEEPDFVQKFDDDDQASENDDEL